MVDRVNQEQEVLDEMNQLGFGMDKGLKLEFPPSDMRKMEE